MIAKYCAVVLAAFALTACSEEAAPRPQQDPEPENNAVVDPLPEGTPTYYGDIAPLLASRCASCHYQGGAGPFPFETYEEVRDLAPLIAHSVENRIMPPFLADASGDCNTYKDSRWLPQSEIDTFVAWADAGAPEGDKSSVDLALTGPNTDDFLADATHTVQLPNTYVPNTSVDNDDYRCFVIDPGVDRDLYLTEYEVVPDNRAIVHHVLLYQPSSDEEVAKARELDANEPGDGFTCYGGPIVDATVAAAWAPGRNVWRYPEGTGVPVRANTPLIMQMHYFVPNEASPDQSAVRLKLEETVDYEILPWFFANTELALPPGKKEAKAEMEISPELYFDEGFDSPWLAEPMKIIGIGPHMHVLGRSERVEITKADGSDTTCLVDVPRWDFNWQFAYFFEEPVELGPRDLMRLSCTFDTTSETEETYWGDGTDDEMCLALMYAIYDSGKIPTGE